jgi:hypothetical protein
VQEQVEAGGGECVVQQADPGDRGLGQVETTVEHDRVVDTEVDRLAVVEGAHRDVAVVAGAQGRVRVAVDGR